MYSAIRSLPLDGCVGYYQGSLDGTNFPGDVCLVLTTDPKPRLRWTAELHERFVDGKYRLGNQSSKESTDNSKDASSIAERQNTGSSTITSSRMAAQDVNEGYQVTEALRVQMEVQRKLHEQLEVQHRLQLRIEAQGKYLQSILEKACKALNDQAAASAV
ncbi:protein PHR1-LIKE 2-like [Hibiscus syriacus]|nr:protein PHR1-LIKE 2-like [Hibiscus syriacus]